MPRTGVKPLAGYLRDVIGTEKLKHQTDAALLARFCRQRDEAAFELLLRRHQNMVLQVCRSLLEDQDDAEDAFQVTFLVWGGGTARRERSPALHAS